MRLKRSLTDEERNKLRKLLLLREKADRDEEDRDNEAFKKSGWYKFSLSLCLFYIAFFIFTYFLGDRFSSRQVEVVQSISHTTVEHYSRYQKRGSTFSFEIKTNIDTYSLSRRKYGVNIEQGDTLIIERNLFGKPIYYFKQTWNKKYRLDPSRIYSLIFVFTLGALAARYWHFVIWIYYLKWMSVVDLIALIAYFVL
jgi:hypothetical protein